MWSDPRRSTSDAHTRCAVLMSSRSCRPSVRRISQSTSSSNVLGGPGEAGRWPTGRDRSSQGRCASPAGTGPRQGQSTLRPKTGNTSVGCMDTGALTPAQRSQGVGRWLRWPPATSVGVRSVCDGLFRRAISSQPERCDVRIYVSASNKMRVAPAQLITILTALILRALANVEKGLKNVLATCTCIQTVI